MRNVRIKLLSPLVIESRTIGLPAIRFRRGTQLNAIVDNFGFVDVVLPRRMHKKMSKLIGKDIKKEDYGYKEHETILGRKKPTKYTKRIRIDYIDKEDEGLMYKIVRG